MQKLSNMPAATNIYRLLNGLHGTLQGKGMAHDDTHNFAARLRDRPNLEMEAYDLY